jgi:hypothetical protein
MCVAHAEDRVGTAALDMPSVKFGGWWSSPTLKLVGAVDEALEARSSVITFSLQPLFTFVHQLRRERQSMNIYKPHDKGRCLYCP